MVRKDTCSVSFPSLYTARCQMPESMYWMKPVSWLPRGIRLRDWVRAGGPSRLWTPWARSRRPSKSSTKSNWRQKQRQGDRRQVLGWYTSSHTHTHKYCGANKGLTQNGLLLMWQAQWDMCLWRGLLPALYSGDVCKRKHSADGKKGPERKTKKDQLLLPYCSYSLLITKHTKFNVNCVYIPLFQLFKKSI